MDYDIIIIGGLIMVIGHPVKCFECRHLLTNKEESAKCEAFPEGIPYSIIIAGSIHDKVWKRFSDEIISSFSKGTLAHDVSEGQVGEFVFEPREK